MHGTGGKPRGFELRSHGGVRTPAVTAMPACSRRDAVSTSEPQPHAHSERLYATLAASEHA